VVLNALLIGAIISTHRRHQHRALSWTANRRLTPTLRLVARDP
jgi:hypothetical protein